MDLSGWSRGTGIVVIGFLTIQLVACAPSATDPHRGWWLWYSVEDERRLGKEASKELEDEIGVHQVEELSSYVNSVGQRVALHSDRQNIRYRFQVLNSFRPNALALPGGYVYVTRGLLQELENEAELAGVLGHEIAHIDAYHSLKRRQGSVIGLTTAVGLAPATGGLSLIAAMLGGGTAIRGYTRTAEKEADRLGMIYSARANYDPEGMVSFLERLLKLSNEVRDRELIMVRTHPYLADRIRDARSRLPAMRRLLTDSALVNEIRYQRNIRGNLFLPREEEVLARLDELLKAYEQADVEKFMSFLTSDFHYAEEQINFENRRNYYQMSRDRYRSRLRKELQGVRRAEYNYDLMDLRKQEETMVMVYEYEITRYPRNGGPATYIGIYKLSWVQEDSTWKLNRLEGVR